MRIATLAPRPSADAATILRAVKARAQGLTEYGLILTFVAFVAIVGLTLFGQGLGDQLGSLLSNLGTSV